MQVLSPVPVQLEPPDPVPDTLRIIIAPADIVPVIFSVLMPNRAFSKNPLTEQIKREPVAAVSCKPQHTADITLYALYQCKMRVFETSKAPLAVIWF
jgi:hypothetical protein